MFSSEIFLPSNMMLRTMIGGNNASATSEFGAIDPMSKPTDSAAIEWRLVKPRKFLNLPFCKFARG